MRQLKYSGILLGALLGGCVMSAASAIADQNEPAKVGVQIRDMETGQYVQLNCVQAVSTTNTSTTFK